MWTREEALASVSTAVFVDFPAAAADLGERELELSGFPPAVFVKRLLQQLGSAASLFSGGGAIVSAILGHEDGVRDYFNKHKLVVLATSSGKLVAIQSKGGNIAWSAYASPHGRPTSTQLFLVREALTESPRALLLLSYANRVSDVAVEFNPLTGEIIATRELG